MLTYTDIQRLASEGEGKSIEFKETTGQLDRGMETLCAFLNGNGGTLLFGITYNGKIIGQDISDKTRRDIADALLKFEPIPELSTSFVRTQQANRYAIAIEVKGQQYARPFMYKGRAYHRIDSVTSVMSQMAYNDLLSQRDDIRHRWESLPSNLSIDDLSTDEIVKTIRIGINSGRIPESVDTSDTISLLRKLNLLENSSIKNAAAVLFAKDMSCLPQCTLRMARFRGIDKNEFIDNQRLSGNIFQLVDAAMSFFFKHLSLAGKIGTLERSDDLQIPINALRECCINAFCHRQYSSPGGSVGIAVFDNRVEIENTGTFPSEIDIDNLNSEYASCPSNPLIANVLYIRKYLESWGRGIKLIINECVKSGLPTPKFICQNNFVRVILFTKQVGEQVGEQVSEQVGEQVRTLVNIIGHNELTVKAIMESLSLKSRRYVLDNYLHPAISGGWVNRLYPEQPNHPRQKYVLSDKAKKLIKQPL